MQEYTQNYLQAGGERAFSEYYLASYDGAVFDRRLVEHAVFAQHNLVSDHGFNEFHAIVCRNVMIYFDRSLQRRVFQLFHDSLVRFGVLGLGHRETIRYSGFEQDYEELDGVEKLWKKVAMNYDLIVIGASWGGLACSGRDSARRSPPRPIAAVVVAQHRKADAVEGGLAGLLAHRATCPSPTPTTRTSIEPGHVYLAPPDYHLLVQPGYFSLSTDERVHFARPSIDVLFESAADAYRERSSASSSPGRTRTVPPGWRGSSASAGSRSSRTPLTAERNEMPGAALAATAADARPPVGRDRPVPLRPLCEPAGERMETA